MIHNKQPQLEKSIDIQDCNIVLSTGQLFDVDYKKSIKESINRAVPKEEYNNVKLGSLRYYFNYGFAFIGIWLRYLVAEFVIGSIDKYKKGECSFEEMYKSLFKYSLYSLTQEDFRSAWNLMISNNVKTIETIAKLEELTSNNQVILVSSTNREHVSQLKAHNDFKEFAALLENPNVQCLNSYEHKELDYSKILENVQIKAGGSKKYILLHNKLSRNLSEDFERNNKIYLSEFNLNKPENNNIIEAVKNAFINKHEEDIAKPNSELYKSCLKKIFSTLTI